MPAPGVLKVTAKRLLSRNFILPLFKGRRFVFLFHDISEPTAPHFSHHYSVTPARFVEIFSFLKQEFRFLPLDELLSDGFSRGNLNCASIVFNDGFMSTLEFAYPYLSREGVPFAVFLNKKAVVDNQGWITNMVLNRGEKSYLERVWKHVIANPVEFDTFQKEPITTLLQRGMRMENSELLYDPRFGERKLYADRDDVLFLHRNGVLIGSHAVGHFVLSQCTPEQLRGMVRDNRLFLEELLNARIEHFSIPFGKKEHYNEQVLDLIQEEHKYIYNTNPAAVPPPRSFNPRCISQISFENAELSDVIFYLNRTFIRNIDI